MANWKGYLVIIGVLAVFVGLIAVSSHTTIDAGYVGVVKNFGVVEEQEFAPGWNWKYPWTEVYPMYVESQSHEFKRIEGTPTKEGSPVTPDIAIQWKLNGSQASDIYKGVADHNYFDNWVVNDFMSLTRTEIQKHTLADIYTGNTSLISSNIMRELSGKLGPKGVIITDVNFRGVEFSADVAASLDKRAAANIAVETAMKNKQAMMIEADGIDYWNRKVSGSVTDTLNTYILNSGIAKNQNAVYYMGASGQGSTGPATSVLIGGGMPSSSQTTAAVKAATPSSSSSQSASTTSTNSQQEDRDTPGFEAIGMIGAFAIAAIALASRRRQ